ncbi:HPr kinase/phosphorylase [Litoreibacter ascidiaceicola]|uniref:HPr kinase/phosphorylase n=1 Tax=Litoreibacter ascidiaceicola TaxID=1486859 RepID=UPI000933B6E2|nr:hypothetical protein [Litoreibacter ascidiaceicola]
MTFSCSSLPCQIHATCVAVDESGLLIVGHSGAGKSALALQLMAFGAELVADDRCELSDSSRGVMARRPDELPEAIEARGIGVLSAPSTGPVMISAIVDLDCTAQSRVPASSEVRLGDHLVRRLSSFDAPHMPAALFHFLKYGFHGSMGA